MATYVQRAVDGVSRSGRRRLLASTVAAGTLVAGLGMAGLAAPAGASTAHGWWGGPSQFGGTSSRGTSSSSTPPPSTCPTTGGIPFTGTLSNGVAKLGSSVSMTGLSGTFCGLANFAGSGLTASIQPQNFTFAAASAKLFGFLSLPATMTVDAPVNTTLALGTGSTFNTSMPLSVSSTVSLLGLFHCTVGPMTPTFTTGTSGSVSGTPLAGSVLTGLSGTLAAGDFAVPAIQASSGCPGLIAGIANAIMGLPLAPGKATITASTTITPKLG